MTRLFPWLPALALGLGLALPGLVSAEPVQPEEVSAPMTWGGVSNVTRLRHLYFSGQPDRAALEKAKAEGVGLVINLRTDAEMQKLGFDEAAAAAELGLRYERVPVGKPPFSKEAFARVEELVAGTGGEPVLIHCASSTRVGAWVASHVAGHHGQSVDEALEVGRRAGLKSRGAEAATRALIEASSESPSP